MTEHDLRELLAGESLDVAGPEEFRSRLDEPRRRSATPAVWYALAAVAVVAMLAAGGRLAPWLRADTPGTATTAATQPHTPHLSLRPSTHYRVILAMDLGDREVLQVSHRTAPRFSLDGGVVTLYAPGVFDASTFLAHATTVLSSAGVVHSGNYAYTGEWGPVTTIAWRLADGRWVSVQNFAGADDAAVRAIELEVARAVIVR